MKIKLWDSGANLFTKIAGVFSAAFAPLLYLFMQLSAFGVFHNIYQKNVAAASGGWHVVGFLLSAFTVAWGIGVAKDSNKVTKSDLGNVLILFASMVLSLLAYGGFSFNG